MAALLLNFLESLGFLYFGLEAFAFSPRGPASNIFGVCSRPKYIGSVSLKAISHFRLGHLSPHILYHFGVFNTAG